MKNHVRYLFTLLALLVLGIGGVKAAEKKITIKYNSTFTPSLPTSGGNSSLTSHSVEGLSIEEQYIYKGNNSAYLMFVQNKGYLYNTENLGTIKSVSVTYSSGCSTAAQAGVYFGSTELSSYTTTSNQTIKGQSQTDTWTNAEANYGFFQLSTSNKNCQITQIDIIYDDGGLPLPEITFDDEVIKIELGKSIKNSISSNATNLTYHFSSDNTNVATVDEQGFVKGIGIGLATITVSWDAVENMYLEGSADFSVAVYPKGSDIFLASDILTANTENSYYDFSNINIFTDAIYAGNAAKSSSGKIQMRSNNNSGIVSTTSGGVIKQVIVGWGENSSARTLDVYGSNTLYSDASDLYDSEKRGTKLGSLTSSPVTTTLDIEDTYDYVGLRSNNNTLYLDYIIFVWDKANTITPTVNDERWGTANITGNIITAIPANGYRISTTNPYEVTPSDAATVNQDGNVFTVTATADCTVQINFEAIPTHTVTFSVNGTGSSATFAEGATIDFPDYPADINGKTFVGWTTSAIDGTTNDKPEYLVTSATMGEGNVTYYAVYANETPGTATQLIDVLTRKTTEVPDQTNDNITYKDWEGKTVISNAIYAGQSAGDYNSIQLRTKNSTEGIVTTASGGKATKVAVIWNSHTTDARTLDIYGSATAYTSASDLYGENKGTKLGSIVYGTSTELTIDGDYAFIGIRSNNGALYLDEISISWENGTPATYSDYCTTLESEEPVVEPGTPAAITAGYYRIMNVGNKKYVNVAGRKTVTFVDADATATAAGTVLKVESNDKGQVQVLRSQAIDLPGYADKAMKYVPEVVQLVVNKLHAEGSGAILGENGLDALMKKFDESFDYHLYTEQAEGGIRIYGKTPSMRPVVEFYNENKDNVDAKLPMLEGFINDAINKILDKTGGRGSSILVPFSLHDVWKNMGSSLTEPKNDATKLTFLQEVLSNEQNVWDFAYQTAMIYWGKVKEHPRYDEFKGKLGDYAKYIDKIEYIRPNVKYYLATDGSNLDVLSQDNELVKNGDVALWSLEERRDFKVTFNEENVLNDKYYTTLYTDFAYDLPEDGSVKAYKVTEVNPTTGVAVKVALESVPAQTPVLLESESAGAKTLTLNTDEGTAPTDNILVGADAIINEYDINESQVVSLFEFALEVLGESTYNEYLAKYEHLMDRNSGTVNNKFFFGLTTKELGEGADEEGLISARSLAMQDNLLGFYENWDVSANHAFLLNKDYDPVKLFLKGDIDRDGDVDNDDLKALIKIILGTDTEEDNYDYDAAHVNDDEDIDIADVTALVNYLKNLQTQTNN